MIAHAVRRFAASRPLIGGSMLGIADQAIVSLSNFLTGVIVARALVPEAFGVYALLWSAVMILGGFQNALITGPARVLGVRPAGVDSRAYFRTQARLQLGLCVGLGLLSGGVLLAIYPAEPQLAVVFVLTLAFVQAQELLRVEHMTRMSLPDLLLLDGLTHGLRIAGLMALAGLGQMTPVMALLVISASSAAAVLTLLSLRASDHRQIPARVAATAAENWRFGRWLLLETIAYSASIQIYMFLTALWVDTAAVGGLTAVLTLMNAINVFVLGTLNIAIPIARTKLIEDGYLAWRHWLIRTGVVLLSMTVVSGFLISTCAVFLLSAVFSDMYIPYSNLAPFVAIYMVLSTANSVFSAAFRTAAMPHVGFLAQLASALLTLLFAVPLITEWGVVGAAVGLVASQVAWLSCFALYSLRLSPSLFPPPQHDA